MTATAEGRTQRRMADASIDSVSTLLALDVAVLLPAPVATRAMALSAGLPADESQGLRLDASHLPHMTLTQQFVAVGEVDRVWEHIDALLRAQPPLRLHATGTTRSGEAVWIAIERSPELLVLHQRLMDALHLFERHGGSTAAFAGGDGRARDVAWVQGYRSNSSGDAFAPHVTLGHAAEAPHVEAFDIDATTVAACHLGRFCTCRHVLRRWTLIDPSTQAGQTSPGRHSPLA